MRRGRVGSSLDTDHMAKTGEIRQRVECVLEDYLRHATNTFTPYKTMAEDVLKIVKEHLK